MVEERREGKVEKTGEELAHNLMLLLFEPQPRAEKIRSTVSALHRMGEDAAIQAQIDKLVQRASYRSDYTQIAAILRTCEGIPEEEIVNLETSVGNAKALERAEKEKWARIAAQQEQDRIEREWIGEMRETIEGCLEGKEGYGVTDLARAVDELRKKNREDVLVECWEQALYDVQYRRMRMNKEDEEVWISRQRTIMEKMPLIYKDASPREKEVIDQYQECTVREIGDILRKREEAEKEAETPRRRRGASPEVSAQRQERHKSEYIKQLESVLENCFEGSIPDDKMVDRSALAKRMVTDLHTANEAGVVERILRARLAWVQGEYAKREETQTSIRKLVEEVNKDVKILVAIREDDMGHYQLVGNEAEIIAAYGACIEAHRVEIEQHIARLWKTEAQESKQEMSEESREEKRLADEKESKRLERALEGAFAFFGEEDEEETQKNVKELHDLGRGDAVERVIQAHVHWIEEDWDGEEDEEVMKDFCEAVSRHYHVLEILWNELSPQEKELAAVYEGLMRQKKPIMEARLVQKQDTAGQEAKDMMKEKQKALLLGELKKGNILEAGQRAEAQGFGPRWFMNRELREALIEGVTKIRYDEETPEAMRRRWIAAWIKAYALPGHLEIPEMPVKKQAKRRR